MRYIYYYYKLVCYLFVTRLIPVCGSKQVVCKSLMRTTRPKRETRHPPIRIFFDPTLVELT